MRHNFLKYLYIKYIYIKTPLYTSQQLIEGILNGNITLLSKAITFIESTNPIKKNIAAQVLDTCIKHAGNSIRIGITGVPGVGKSTFIDVFGKHIIETYAQKVAVLAIDPSSKLSHGSILGDKTRMEFLSHNPNAFIRPSPNNNTLGGIALQTKETITLCEAAGFNVILVETVGVGQSETEVHSLTDCFLLLLLSGAGDELQGVKRGIMELANIIYITKADNDNLQSAKIRAQEIKSILQFMPQSYPELHTKVGVCSALQPFNIENVFNDCLYYINGLKANNYFNKQRETQEKQWIEQTFQRFIFDNFNQIIQHKININALLQQVLQKQISVFTALQIIKSEIK